MLFFKMYDPKQKKIHYCGHAYVPAVSKFGDLCPLLNERAGFAPDTELLLYEEIRPNMIEKILNFTEPINKASSPVHLIKLTELTVLSFIGIGGTDGRGYYYFRKR